MGLLDLLFRKKAKENQIDSNKTDVTSGKIAPTVHCPKMRSGHVELERIILDVPAADLLRNEFIAFDVETTGLNPTSDRIVEIGAVLFVDGQPADSFSSLVNPGKSISPSASAVNHITNDMVKTAPSEEGVYENFVSFLGKALQGEIIMCAHNASFDFGFLANTLSRLGYDGIIRYADTLSMARQYVCGLENYKQCTLENHFDLVNIASHRAASDAENCGHILNRILECASEVLEAERKQIEMATPSEDELAVCAFIQGIITENGNDVNYLRFRKNSANYVEATCLYPFVKFKFAKKGRYIILSKSVAQQVGLPSEPCTASEGGTDFIRVYFSTAFDLQPFAKEINRLFVETHISMKDYTSYSKRAADETNKIINHMKALNSDDVSKLLAMESQRETTPITISLEPVISRDSVNITATHNRVPLSEIKNADNWSKGFEAGFKYYEKGEEVRKSDHIEDAITLFDKARYYGYCAPALYNAYAIAYRQIKDYENEVLILEEGMIREPSHSGEFEARRDKALRLLYIKQEAVRKAEEKDRLKAEKLSEKTVNEVPKAARGRSILQLDDNGNIINEYDTIASATREVGISSKSIRDAASGVQKHAGGYCWAYKDEPVQIEM